MYSQADADSLHVRLADEAVCIGPPERKGSYLNAPNILSAAVITGCDAVHPGIGFLAEVASFAEMCDAIGLKYIGPPVRAIELMGDKIEARATMERAGVPIVPGTNTALRDPSEAARVAARIGFPVMIKAAGGGGGRGIRVVQNKEEFPKILKTAQVEAGERLPFSQRDIHWNGHAIEVRLTARDPARDFAPSAGKITSLRLPGGLGVRIDTHVYAGYEVPPYYDSMIAKIIVWDDTRDADINRMQRALDEVEIGGVKTDLEYHKKILANALFRKGDLNTKFLQTHVDV